MGLIKAALGALIAASILCAPPVFAGEPTGAPEDAPGWHYIGRKMGIFENKYDEGQIGMISPQMAKVIERDQNWLLIDTWLGPKWVNLDYEPPVGALGDIMRQYGGTVSVYYENLETGFVYRHNAGQMYNTASVIKAPYCLYIYDLMENGQADGAAGHAYTKNFYYGGSGVIKNMKVGTIFTENELLALMIRESDNIATRMLMSIYGVDGFKEFASRIGGDPSLINEMLYARPAAQMDVDEAALYMKAIYAYIEGGHKYSSQFKEDLLNVSYTAIASDFPVAHKYGMDSGLKAFHDIAVVYSDSPYALVIMSNRASPADKDFAAFRDISMAVQDFNEKYFVNYTRER